jgi:small-conductance mechanosensitive channel
MKGGRAGDCVSLLFQRLSFALRVMVKFANLCGAWCCLLPPLSSLNYNGETRRMKLREASFTDKYIVPEELYMLICVIASVTVVLLVVRWLIPRLTAKVSARFAFETRLVGNLNRHLRSVLNMSYVIFLLDYLATIPPIKRFSDPVLRYRILDVETLTLSLSSLIRGVLGFFLLLMITKVLRTLIRMYLMYRSGGKEIESTVDILVYNSALVVITLLSLSLMGISWKLLLPVAGALGIGIGFGVRDIANNFVSGFVVLTSRSVKRGDWITLGGNFGRIVDVGIRTSTLRTLDNIDIIIPNSHLISNELINWSYTDNIVRIHVPVGVSYSSDTNLVRETLHEVARGLEYVLEDPAPEARFMEFGDNSLDFELLVWIDLRKIKIPLMKSIINYAIWNAFKEKGIRVPFPQRDVWFRNELKIEDKGQGPE